MQPRFTGLDCHNLFLISLSQNNIKHLIKNTLGSFEVNYKVILGYLLRKYIGIFICLQYRPQLQPLDKQDEQNKWRFFRKIQSFDCLLFFTLNKMGTRSMKPSRLYFNKLTNSLVSSRQRIVFVKKHNLTHKYLPSDIIPSYS